MSRDILLIMNAREIPQCISGFQSLKIDKAWFRGFTEQQLEAPIAKFVEETDYDNYLLASDDLVPTQPPLDVVRKGLERHPIFTGYCNISPTIYRGTVRFRPIHGNQAFYVVTHMLRQLYPLTQAMRFNSFAQLSAILAKRGEFRTYFMGNVYTGMRRDLWLRFPFRVYHPPWNKSPTYGFGSDMELSMRLIKAGIPMMCHSDAFVYHLASGANNIVGKVKPEVIFDPFEPGPKKQADLNPLEAKAKWTPAWKPGRHDVGLYPFTTQAEWDASAD